MCLCFRLIYLATAVPLVNARRVRHFAVYLEDYTCSVYFSVQLHRTNRGRTGGGKDYVKVFIASPNHVVLPRDAWCVLQFIVYGDSNTDVGRRYMSDNSYQFPDIGPFPWPQLYDASNPDVSVPASRATSPRCLLLLL